MKMGRIDRAVLIAGLLSIALLGFLLYRDYNEKLHPAGGVVRGIITWRYHVAQRKYSDTVLWENLEHSAPVYNQDTIRTDTESEATIRLHDGTKIEMDQESMLVLNLDDASTRLRLLKGSMVVDRNHLSRPIPDFTVESKNRILLMDGDSEGSFSLSPEGLYVTPEHGVIRFRDSKNVLQILTRGSTGKFLEDLFQRSFNDIRLLSPADGDHFFTDRPEAPIRFSWSAKDKGQIVVVEVSDRQDFQHILLSRSSDSDSLLLPVSTGIRYWRVRSAVEKAPEEYESRHVIVLEKHRAVPLSPSKGDRYEYKETLPLVLFSWEKTDGADRYLLEVANDSAFKDVKESRMVQNNRISLALARGDYFWRVTPQGPYADAFIGTKSIPFSVALRREIPAPVPALPVDGSRIEAGRFPATGVVFNWKMDQELVSSRLEISNTPDFKGSVLNRDVDGNYLTIHEAVAPGDYYWRVTGRNAKGIATSYSKVVHIVVTAPEPGATAQEQTAEPTPPATTVSPPATTTTPERTTPTPAKEPVSPVAPRAPAKVVLLSPAPGSVVDMSAADRIRFRWRSSKGSDSYILRLYRNGREIHREKTDKTSVDFTDLSLLDTGGFEWSVEAWGNGLTEGETKAGFTITLKETPAAPTGITTQPDK